MEISQIKIEYINAVEKIAGRHLKRVQNPILKGVISYLGVNYASSKIMEMTDEEVRMSVWDDYNDMKDLAKKLEMILEIKKGEEFGSPPIPRTESIKRLFELDKT